MLKEGQGGRHMADTWQTHGRHMAGKQTRGRHMADAWQANRTDNSISTELCMQVCALNTQEPMRPHGVGP